MRLAIFAAVALLLLGSLWIGLRPEASSPVQVPLASAPDAQDIEAPVLAAPERVRFMLQAPLPEGVTGSVLRTQVGDSVEITVTSAADDELHLHGYDLVLQLKAGEPGTLAFVAEHAGRFEVELHRGHSEIAVLEVSPR